MSASKYLIYTTWDPEADGAAVHAERVRESLTEFGLASPALRSWGILDRAQGKPVPLDKAGDQLNQIVPRGVAAVRFPELPGSRCSFMVIGAGRRSFRGACAAVFETEFSGTPDPSVVAWPVFRSMMSALAPIWNATYMQAYTNTIQEHWDNPRRVFELSWMTYLSEEFARQIEVPANIFVEEVPGAGVILCAVKGDFDATNPEHLSAAQTIREALAPLNKLYAPPWQKPGR